MKLNGQKINSRNEELIIIPRSDGNHIVFKATAIQSFDKFEQLYPEPKPPMMIGKGGAKTLDIGSPIFKTQVAIRNQAKTNWMIIQSLKATPNLEWETVDETKPETFENFNKELVEAGLSDVEIARIIRGVLAANSLDEQRVEEARQSFLLRQMEEAQKSSSQQDGLINMESGVPAND